MSLAQLLSLYLSLNAVMITAYFALRLFSLVNEKLNSRTKAGNELKLHYFVLTTVLCLTVSQPFLPKCDFFQPPIKVWSGQSIATFKVDRQDSRQQGYIALPAEMSAGSLNANKLRLVLFALLVFTLSLGIFRLGRDLLGLIRIRRKSFLIRQIGNVFIYSNDEIEIPFSYWLPFQAGVIIPISIVSKPIDFQMTVAHELQHHRQRDTVWVYLFWGMQVLCAPNPLIHFWSKWICQLQEFACDETLIDREKVESRQYARCLIEVAQSALHQKTSTSCATGLIFLVERNILKRRIEKMMSLNQNKMRKTVSFTLAGALLVLLTSVSFASQALVQDRRISLADAQAMASHVSDDGFPIVVNDLVLKELNRYLGTPDGREFMKLSLQRLENYRSLVESKIKEHHLPKALIVIPIVESGYQNLPEKNHHGVGAGLWMFMAQTARDYGMHVNDRTDQRLDTTLETDAAMRYFREDHGVFKDWLLTTLAYNMGGKAVKNAILKSGSRDAWTLVRQGHQNDEGYLARVEAAILILNNPKSLQ